MLTLYRHIFHQIRSGDKNVLTWLDPYVWDKVVSLLHINLIWERLLIKSRESRKLSSLIKSVQQMIVYCKWLNLQQRKEGEWYGRNRRGIYYFWNDVSQWSRSNSLEVLWEKLIWKLFQDSKVKSYTRASFRITLQDVGL